jgi:hypothetical protein
MSLELGAHLINSRSNKFTRTVFAGTFMKVTTLLPFATLQSSELARFGSKWFICTPREFAASVSKVANCEEATTSTLGK